jgi:hypothetical protein
MNWTDRYLAAVLRSIPGAKRADMERELRSSISDAVEERVGAGEDPAVAERAVLEDLGDPARLAAGYTGQPTHLIGPELFPLWRRFLSRVLVVAVPLAALVIGGLSVIGNGDVPAAVGAAISGAISVAIQTTFWLTAFFFFLDWAGPASQARAEIIAASGKWTLERLPKVSTGRISLSETAGEIVTVLISIGALIFAATLTTTSGAGEQVPLFSTDFRRIWLPILVATLALRGVDYLRAYNAGRWTRPHAVYHGLVHLAFGVLVVMLAMMGWILNPAFGQAINVGDLADGGGLVMRWVAIVAAGATIYELVRVFTRARRSDRLLPMIDAAPHSA